MKGVRIAVGMLLASMEIDIWREQMLVDDVVLPTDLMVVKGIGCNLISSVRDCRWCLGASETDLLSKSGFHRCEEGMTAAAAVDVVNGR